MKLILIFTGLAALLLTSSCEKHNTLLNERARIEAEIKQCQETLQALDAKFETLGANAVSAVTVFERQQAEWMQKNTRLEQELAYISNKCSDGEEALKQARPRVDSFKSKFAR
ncbi:hypothetical protein [Prosthecobacter sp.]|uniref:hypothetical protein n=1 Tax=Prosthecobacter sp. TaxID=1965333 RepID=UPI002AB8A016|nr:hypothetical protein [Prosthecobacter sp.]MDZ4405198.1 hypothetical protein [Prosthecobacter sp.]